MTARRATELDEYIGMRLRLRRSLLDMSQGKLGEQLGVMFQQIQKYERGTNRIGAGRLYEVAAILDVPITYFYEGLDPKNPQAGSGIDQVVLDFLKSPDAPEVACEFAALRTAQQRQAVRSMMRVRVADECD